jgi:hypothetical protein
MALKDQYDLSSSVAFQQRVQASLVSYCLNTINAEVTNDQQTVTVTGSPTGGSFALSGGPLTSSITPVWNDTAQTLAAKIAVALAAGASVVCTGGPFPGTGIVCTWTGALGNSPQNVVALGTNLLTGGSSPSVTIAHTTVGVAAVNHAARAAFSSKVLFSPAAYGVLMACSVATDTTVQSDYTGGGSNQASVTDAHINAAVAAQVNSFI